MDKQRLVLFLSLAVIAYLLVLAWNEDYGQPVSPPVAQVQQNTATPIDLDMTEPSSSDLPSATAAPDASATAQSSIPAVTSQISNIIHVKTDVFDININPRGGDIVKAALTQFPRVQNQPENPFLLLQNDNERTYIAQSGLIGANGPDSSKAGRPVYQVAQNNFELIEGENTLTVDLMLKTAANVSIIKRFTFTRGDYLIDIEYLIDNQSASPWQANFFAQLKRDNSADPSQTTSMGMASFLGAATTTPEERYKKVKFKDLSDESFKEKNTGGWVAILQHYFIGAWVPNENQQHTYEVRKNQQGENIAGLVSPATVVAPGASGSVKAQFYAGPKNQDRLEQISPSLELTIDYGWLWFIGQPLFWVLSKLHGIFGNWGWAIVFTTLLIKLAFFHLSATSYRSMANMRRVGPQMQRIKEQHGGDRQKMSSAMMELYKKEKINPLGGCLPILVQMPVFISLYWVLMESVELRQAPFMLWLTDLSVKDPLFILPILMGVTMFIQQTLNPTPPDPTQAKIMKIMPVMFTFFFLWFPAGLVLYWVVNNILSIAQQWYITRQIEKKSAATSASS